MRDLLYYVGIGVMGFSFWVESIPTALGVSLLGAVIAISSFAFKKSS